MENLSRKSNIGQEYAATKGFSHSVFLFFIVKSAKTHDIVIVGFTPKMDHFKFSHFSGNIFP